MSSLPHMPVTPKLKCVPPLNILTKSRTLPWNPSISTTHFFSQTSDPSNLPVSVFIHHPHSSHLTASVSSSFPSVMADNWLLTPESSSALCVVNVIPSQGLCFSELTLLSICLHLLHLCRSLPAAISANFRPLSGLLHQMHGFNYHVFTNFT